ncbi:hypothetical protein KSP39_PZI020862 [Platanthera zijinensis]|uniref:Uncharacterized protein n=1 Tax=Platanthera zijinensis TaxID=2320716 RepID=A0AAP0AZX6_9ASPA
MGKGGKKKKKGVEKQLRRPYPDGGDELPSSAYDLPRYQEECCEEAREEDEAEYSSGGGYTDAAQKETSGLSSLCFDFTSMILLFTFLWFLEQSPKGDITYLQKFFLMYVGGRRPLHLQEDFCGTALLSHSYEYESFEKLYGRAVKHAVNIDKDMRMLRWILESRLIKVIVLLFSNINKPQKNKLHKRSGCVRIQEEQLISLFHGNVLHPHKAHKVEHQGQDHARSTMEEAPLPPRDIICAFNYSCCCLQQRADLVRYFKHTLSALSNKGGIFVMDVYGGTSSERKLRLQRKFTNFTYIWEQGEFDIISRRTRISLHFQLGKMGMLRHAFSYAWRLWSLPEIRDCMEEAGFQSIHFWIREMPNTEENEHCEEYNADRDVKYEDSSTFRQQDSWNAYVVGIANL